MHYISKSAIVGFSSKEMFDLVNDIDAYPQFLNWCQNSSIISKNGNEVIASIEVNQAVFKQSFTTINTLEINKKIQMRLKDGPFKTLQGAWIFQELNENASKVALELEFNFSNKLLDISLSPIFGSIASSQLDAFVKRAKIVYG
ncbi:Putative oligoketide cyclase/lipid transport protein, similarity with yeast ubiquinone-binding protein YOL008W [hydrothermal vent metagenome]|uniref:Putative oligoketide cyclase/lipid transport protein, similarity with yeast ubiquinone-binding protein YOL008W n=1 Tax=hydrothermal vent metagenome TaxID=652676 RepID=A0A1W1BP67_9ZZZZ